MSARALVAIGASTALLGAAAIACSSGGGNSPAKQPTEVPAAHTLDGGGAGGALAQGDGGGSAAAAAVDAALEREAQAKNERRIARMLRKVTAARGLTSTRDVPGVTLARDKLLARVREHVAREVPKQAILHEGLVLQLLGFIPTHFDYEAQTFALLEAQLAGYYEPADHSMYMAADLDEDNADATLAHELVHALQDQHWDLAKRGKYEPGHGDAQSSESALAEGDATSAMMDVLMTGTGHTAVDLPEDIFTQQVMTSMATGPGKDAPHAMRASLVAPYVDGTRFVNALRKKGGWPAVDAAWNNPPITSEQILHLDKYEAHEPPFPVSTPTAAPLGAAWKVAEQDTYGELGLRLALAEWTTEDHASAVAAHWGGDRGALFQNGDSWAFGWKIVYDRFDAKSPATYGERAYPQLVAALENTLGKPKTKDGSSACFERAELGPLAVFAKGRSMALVVGPTKSSGVAPWASDTTCTAAVAWAKELTADLPAK